MNDFTLWEVIGSLPFLENFTVKAINRAPHPAHAPENSDSRSGGPKYFDALQTLCVTGSFTLIEHLFGFVDSPWLTTIKIFPIVNPRHEYEEDPLTPSMTIVASKWSQSLKNLVIDSTTNSSVYYHAFPLSLTMLTDLHEMQVLLLKGLLMESDIDDDMRRLVKSWPKLRRLRLPHLDKSISLSTLRIIAENCPDLHFLQIPLNAFTIPPFDTSSKSLHHKLEVLSVGRFHTHYYQTSLEFQIQVARFLTLTFPYLSIEMPYNYKDVTWSGIRDLVMLCQDVRRVQ